MIGKSLGPYEILEPLGAGGMGEVWLAEDTRLGRKVAVKVLPEEFASIPERLARFEQEARAAAALNHPNIAVIHDVGSDDGVHYMVQERLEGRTLREVLDKGAMPVRKALDLATEVGEALAAAHEAGIVHRDLKPANVFVTRAGHAKVLDFGLAKLTEAVMLGAAGSDSKSPTMLGTVAGQVMGTAGYMAPEQVQGEEIDHRADIFAFGCLLYEVVTGRQAFAGKNVLDTLHRIANSEPQPLAEVDASLPVDLQRILRKCLAKEPSARYQTAADLVVDLRGLAAEIDGGTVLPLSAVSAAVPHASGAAAPDVAPAPRSKRGVLYAGLVAGALVAVLVAGAVGWRLLESRVSEAAVTRFEFAAPGLSQVVQVGARAVAISPDGRYIYVGAIAASGGTLFRRPMDGLELEALPGAPPIGSPRVSPDGRWVLGWRPSSGRLARLSTTGGAPLEIPLENPMGGDWLDDDTIVASDGFALFRVGAGGGESEKLVDVAGLDGRIYVEPQVLPGGSHVLVTEYNREREGAERAVVVSLTSGAIDAVVAPVGGFPLYVDSGHVLYVRSGTVEAVAFDSGTLAVIGQPVPVLSDVVISGDEVPQLDVSTNGTLVYLSGQAPGGRNVLMAVDRDGDVREVLDVDGRFVRRPRLSPDGTRVALEVSNNNLSQIRVYDLERGTFTPLPQERDQIDPVWNPDGASLTYSSVRSVDEEERLVMRAADGTGGETVLPVSPGRNQNAYSWSPNGELAVYSRPVLGGDTRDIAVLSRDDDWNARVILDTDFNERSPAFSPDGNWLAYVSDEGGQSNVYVLRYPGLDRRITVSPDGGIAPAWSADGGELYYISLDDAMMAASVEGDEELRIGRPERLFSVRNYEMEPLTSGSRPYDVAADGRFFLIGSGDEADDDAPVSVTVVLNWFEELRRLVPGSQR